MILTRGPLCLQRLSHSIPVLSQNEYAFIQSVHFQFQIQSAEARDTIIYMTLNLDTRHCGGGSGKASCSGMLKLATRMMMNDRLEA